MHASYNTIDIFFLYSIVYYIVLVNKYPSLICLYLIILKNIKQNNCF